MNAATAFAEIEAWLAGERATVLAREAPRQLMAALGGRRIRKAPADEPRKIVEFRLATSEAGVHILVSADFGFEPPQVSIDTVERARELWQSKLDALWVSIKP